MKTYFLQVKEVIKETSDAVTIQFWHPISEEIKYKAGQFITILLNGSDGKKITRSYSMSSSPATDTAIAVTVKKVHDGFMSNYLNQNVKAGDFLEVIEPMGNFVYENQNQDIVLIGAGSGITPLISIAKTALKTQSDKKVTLIYGNRYEDSIIFKNLIEKMASDYGQRFQVIHVLSSPSENWSGLKGRIDQNNLPEIFNQSEIDFPNSQYYICGPNSMMNEVKAFVENKGGSQVFYEKFNTTPLSENEIAEAGITKQHVKINYNGDEYEFEVQPHQTILEAALELNIDLPYSCQAGMCTACMGKCLSGKVVMDEEEGLTESEIQEGYVLTCVSHPKGAGVVIEID